MLVERLRFAVVHDVYACFQMATVAEWGDLVSSLQGNPEFFRAPESRETWELRIRVD